MIDKILIYSPKACGEVALPSIPEEYSGFRIEKDVYGLTEDLYVKMLVMDRQWVFAPSKSYRVMKGEAPYTEKKLHELDVLNLENLNTGDNLILVMAKYPSEIPKMSKYVLDNKRARITIGTDPQKDIVVSGLNLISPSSAELNYELSSKEWVLINSGDILLYADYHYVKDRVQLSYGTEINMCGIRMICLGDLLVIQEPDLSGVQIKSRLPEADEKTMKWFSELGTVGVQGDHEDILFSPAPRIVAELDTGMIEIDAPPAQQTLRQGSLITAIGPSVTMVIPMLLGTVLSGYLGPAALIMTAGSAIIMSFWTAINYRNQKKEAAAAEERRNSKYIQYLERKEKEISSGVESVRRTLHETYPSASECLSYDTNSKGLWNRNRLQEDYLFIRLGVGEIQSPKKVKIPADHFSLSDDRLLNEPKRIADIYEKIGHVPVGINLGENNVFGVIGGKDRKGCYQVLRILIGQLAANFNYSDLKMVLLCDNTSSKDRSLLEAVKWLPHMWKDDRSFRFTGDTEESVKEVLNELGSILKNRWELAKNRTDKVQYVRYVIFATSEKQLKGNLVSSFLYDESVDISTNVFICGEDIRQIPNSCSEIIENSESFSGYYLPTDSNYNWKKVIFDEVSEEILLGFSKRLAPVKLQTPETQQEIPDMLTFLGMYGANRPEDLEISKRWTTHRSFESLSASIGYEAGGMVCNLDIHEKAHGPHGLVAGTTGSGKSETLMTWVLSLAVNYSPEDVSFLLVDFKGGGLANQFDNPAHRLPHLVGTVTNLGGNQINRALASINSENIRRQKLLASGGANDIYEYTRLWKNGEVSKPLPHLIIVVDEFAELKKQFPDFMSELISVAAIGRSLGVHLVLATQKPAGVVDDKINSNTRFRICLKVQTEEDSKDMLKRPDAAYITQMGRGYLRVGADEILELFQTAWARAPYLTNKNGIKGDIAKLCNITGRTEIVGTHQRTLRKEEEATKWAEELLKVVEVVLTKEHVSTSQYLAQPDGAEQIHDSFYEYFRDKGWNITKTPINDSRLMDLITVYDSILQEGREVTPENLRSMSRQLDRSLPELSAVTQLDAVVEYMSTTVERVGMALAEPLWLPELPSRIYLGEKLYSRWEENGSKELVAKVGRFDDPAHQYQADVYIDFSNVGNYVVCGSVLSGKSTFLQTLLYSLIQSYTPNQLHVYALDFSGRMLEAFAESPHIGGITGDDNPDAIKKFFYLMLQILSERKQLLKGVSFRQYIEKNTLPAVLIMIDQYGSFREKTDSHYDAEILRLAKEGLNYGIYMIFTVGSVGGAEFPSKLADLIKGRVCLALNDPYEYRNVLNIGKIDILPKENIRGRGVLAWHGSALEFQTALCVKADGDNERNELIEKFCSTLENEWQGKRARPIPALPANPAFNTFMKLEEVKEYLSDDRSIPIGYDQNSACPFCLDMSKFYRFVISGKERSGKTNFMTFLMKICEAKGGKIYVFGSGKGILKKIAGEVGAFYRSFEENLYPFYEEFKEELTKRNNLKHTMEIDGAGETEIYSVMSKEQPVFIFIEDMTSFTQMLYHPGEGMQDVHQFFEVFTEKGWNHYIFLFGGIDQDNLAVIRGVPFYESFVRDRCGAHFGGNIAAQSLLSFDYISSYKEQTKTESPEIAYIATGDGRMKSGKVIIPDALN